MPRPRYIALLALAVADISTASILVRLSGVPGFVAASWRLILSSAITLAAYAVLEARRGPPRPSPRDTVLMVVSGVALAFHFGLWMMSLSYMSVASSVTIVDSYPAVLAVAGRFLLGERYAPAQLLGAAVALAGVAGLSLEARSAPAPPGARPLLGAALSLAGMLCVALYFSIGKAMRGRHSTLEYTGIVYGAAALASVIATRALGYGLTGYPGRSYVYLVLLALLPMLGGHTIINYVLPRLSLLAATVPVLGEPLGASLLAWLILGEPLTPGEALWMTVTLAGIGAVLAGEEPRM
ncbi:MAG: DMT family transporter [Desulfurococcales archaeon]|nr:DMT family transporter [Desulfurococcales archaeon]